MISAFQSSQLVNVKGFRDLFPPKKLTAKGKYLYGYLNLYYKDGISEDFKYFIPPGTVKYILTVDSSGPDAYVDMRIDGEYGTLPSYNYDYTSDDAYYQGMLGYTIDDARASDKVCEPIDNKITLINHTAIQYVAGQEQYVQTPTEHWIYANWMGKDKQVYHRLEFVVDKYRYEDWYNNEATWGSDGEYAAIESFTGITYMPEHVDFGTVYTGLYGAGYSFGIQNFTSESAVVDLITTDISPFKIDPAIFPVTVKPGEDNGVGTSLLFSPDSSGGNKSYEKILEFNAKQKGVVVQTFKVPLSGTFAGVNPNIIFDKSSLDFGTVTSGSTSTRSIKITNNTDSHVIFTGTLDSPFSCSQSSRISIGSGKESVLSIIYSPTDKVNTTHSKSFTFSIGVTITLTGNCTYANTDAKYIEVSPTSYDFGSVGVGDKSESVEFKLNNVTGSDIFVSGTTISGSPFLGVLSGNTLSIFTSRLRVFRNGSSTFSLQFTPKVIGTYDQILTLEAKDPFINNVTQKVQLRLTGVCTSSSIGITFDKTSIDFGTVESGKTNTQYLKITNNSTTTAKLKYTILSPFTCDHSADIVIQAGKYESLTIVYAPTDKGATTHTKDLTFSNGAVVKLTGSCSYSSMFSMYKSLYSYGDSSYLYTLGSCIYSSYGKSNDIRAVIDDKVKTLKVFIPPGLYNHNVYFEFDAADKDKIFTYSAVMAAVPDEPKSSTEGLVYTGYSIKEFIGKTIFGGGLSSNNILYVCKNSDNDELKVTECGWLYIKLYWDTPPVKSFTLKQRNDINSNNSCYGWHTNFTTYSWYYSCWNVIGKDREPIDDYSKYRTFSSTIHPVSSYVNFLNVNVGLSTTSYAQWSNNSEYSVTNQGQTFGDVSYDTVTIPAKVHTYNVNLTWKPKTVGNCKQLVTFKDNYGRYAYISAYGTATGSISDKDYDLSPSSYDFGYKEKGTVSVYNFNFYNYTTNSITATTNLPECFSCSPTSFTVNGNSKQSIAVTFSPTDTKAYSGELVVSKSGSSSVVAAEQSLSSAVDTRYFSVYQKELVVSGRTYRGYKDMMNPNRAVGTATDNIVSLAIDRNNLANISAYGTNQIRYYIPKGARSCFIKIMGFFSKNLCAALVRFGKAPTAEIPSDSNYFLYPENYPDVFPTSKYPDGRTTLIRGRNISEYAENDLFVCSSGDYLHIFGDGNAITDEYNGWLYVQLIPYGASEPKINVATLYLDDTTYTSWYDSYTAWDSNGDPTTSGSITSGFTLTASKTELTKDAGTVDISVSGITGSWQAVSNASWLGFEGGNQNTSVSEYFSVHQVERDVYYGNNNVIKMKGFKSIWSPTDPRINCQQDLGTICPNNFEEYGGLARSMNISSNVSDLIGDKFRVYIPKGTTAGKLILYVPQSGDSCVLLRVGQPPTTKVPTNYDVFLTPEAYPEYFPIIQYPNGRDDLFGDKQHRTFEQLKSNDWFYAQTGGHNTILDLVLNVDNPIQEGMWLYIIFIKYKNTTIQTFSYSWFGKTAVYKSWYDSYTAWDSNGDPAAEKSLTTTYSGTGAKTFPATYTASTSNRTATVTVTPTATAIAAKSVSISQGAALIESLKAVASSTSFTKEAGTFTITVIAEVAWTATKDATWLTIKSGATGTGNGTITCEYTANTGSALRTGKITINDAVISVAQRVTTTSTSLMATASATSLSNKAGSFTITVSGASSWVATSNSSWLKIGSAGVCTYDENTNKFSRKGVVSITANSGAVDITVTQAGTVAIASTVYAKASLKGTSSTSSPDSPTTISTYADLANEYASLYVNAKMAATALDNNIKKFSAMSAVINKVTPNKTGDALDIFKTFNLGKISGGFGVYGVDTAVTALTAMLSGTTNADGSKNNDGTINNNITFYKSAAEVYSQLNSGTSVSSITPASPPGYDSSDSSNPDKDDKESTYYLKRHVDYHMLYRKKKLSSNRTTWIEPDSSLVKLKVGDLYMKEDIIYNLVEEYPTGITKNSWYPVGLQEYRALCPMDDCDSNSTTTTTDKKYKDYDIRHIKCNELVKVLCNDDEEDQEGTE